MNYKRPGVFVEEISLLPPSIAAVETAIPAFIGYTQKHNDSVKNRPFRIKSLADYVETFGKRTENFTAEVDENGEITTAPVFPEGFKKLYYSLQLYYANGGGPCYIISIGKDDVAVDKQHFLDGLAALKKQDEPTMIVMPDALLLGRDDYYEVQQASLKQCADLGDRVAIIDVYNGDDFHITVQDQGADIRKHVINDPEIGFRSKIGNNFLKYGAAYFPNLDTILNFQYDEKKFVISGTAGATKLRDNAEQEQGNSLFHQQNGAYHKIKDQIDLMPLVLPPSPAIAGIYAYVDRTRGVWKAPANVSVSFVNQPTTKVDDTDQRDLNVHTTGKSINAIRTFKGKGILVWGSRTLAGNDNEWRYVPVRRFYNMAEESIKKGTEPFVFEPNDRNTWTKVRGMIENFLTLQWRAGALAGATPDEAFFVKVGLPETMTSLDISEGRMIVEIGMAVVRPAEFIILKFSHKLPEG